MATPPRTATQPRAANPHAYPRMAISHGYSAQLPRTRSRAHTRNHNRMHTLTLTRMRARPHTRMHTHLACAPCSGAGGAGGAGISRKAGGGEKFFSRLSKLGKVAADVAAGHSIFEEGGAGGGAGAVGAAV